MAISRGGKGVSRFRIRAPVKFKRVYRVGGESALRDGITKELGLNDMILETKEELPVGARVYMEFKLPDGHPIKTEGMVVQCIPTDKDFCEIQINFVGLSAKDRVAIDMVGYRAWIQSSRKNVLLICELCGLPTSM
ncbi:MAG: hypothetical protein GXO71_03265 [Caldiserica bacterium]|nr:hypothetical protein [Caldisericota bacterium]